MGSITHIATGSGSLVQELSYDVPGRFLSPDPYVQSPDFSQNFNRYSYCLNNPLKYTDENGEFWHIIIGAVIGGIVNVAIHWNQIDSFGEGLAAFGIGAGGGALAAATGGLAMGAFGTGIGAGGFIGGAVAGGVGYTSNTAITGIGNHIAFGDPLPTAKQFVTGLGISMLTGGAINGTVAALNGRNFLTGKLPTPKHTMPDLSRLTKPDLPKTELQGPQQQLQGMDNSTPIANSKGVPYPEVEVPGYGKVPFPEGPYTPNNSASLRPNFSNHFKSDFKNWWIEQGRTLPTGDYQIHHIKPLFLGGTNSFNNLVPLQTQQHLQFTKWWMSFKITF